jgi:acetoacetyl-CoA synthetase
MPEPLWTPSEARVRQANMTRFITWVNREYGLSLRDYMGLWRWSVADVPAFWEAVWEFCGVVASHDYDQVVDDLRAFPGARWFSGSRLNFAENLLRHRDAQVALSFCGEDGRRASMTYAELYKNVARAADALRRLGVQPGDRVVGYMPNLIETAIAMLAATSIGAVWASCATDIGPRAALDRLGQVQPKVLFAADGYTYKGRPFDTLSNAAKVAGAIPSLERVIVVPFISSDVDLNGMPYAETYPDFLARSSTEEIAFEQLTPDHPVYIMFSSGTTGQPKCMVQGAAGVLVNHLKELILHSDLRRDDRILYLTTCSWMMWNWLLSALGVGATVVLYEGNPAYPSADEVWSVIEELGVTVFGTSGTYLHSLYRQDLRPGSMHDLSTLREISQTGSPLSITGFEYVYQAVKEDLHLNSISGGTDINGCFAAGSPTLPVFAGQIQGPALGMKVAAYDDVGERVFDRQGELVCEAPSPSMPLRFWDDPGGEKYREAYFTFFPGRDVWRHGDFVTFHSDTGGVTIHGRSDAVLKPSGVRIGTAEIYNVLMTVDAIADCLAVAQKWDEDQRILLFVKLVEGSELTLELKEVIRQALFTQASPRHVPALILEAPDIPYTFSQKKVERAVTDILNGRPVVNREAIANPESLDFFESIVEELRS